MRTTVLAVPLVIAGAVIASPAAGAEPLPCAGPECVPGIAGNVVLGAPCTNTTHYVFGTTDWGRLVFCGSPRRYAPRYFRSPPMEGIRVENTNCTGFENSVAQAPDGLFLSCVASSGESLWVRGDNS
ncbi:hypothetical protein NIIDNTM18_03240 [Mycolicibacterium litorale]|uniref:Secreted protein n=1 Tax=Mycolicibacterium litorale TaxID=758802 RepID=A0A6S6NZG2_9MYCO|nr:hypothetical protein [Mycolicibacterium litorale]BCI51046.1 hypothetical protein NIIDNTM18_03240 [Mycolicibacterium litorale]